MEPELEHHRRGVAWKDRRRLLDHEPGDLLPESAPPSPAPEPWCELDPDW